MAEIILPDAQAEQTQRDYVCAGCWGRINIYYQKGGLARVVCDKCGDGRGFVTKRYAERRREEDFAEASEVRRMLRQIKVITRQPKTTDELLKELGF